MASVDAVVDLYDNSTWCDVDYDPLVNVIHRRIALHSIHQQHVENHVEMAAHVASTHVGEDRRPWRAISLSKIMRHFNKYTVGEKEKKS